MEEIKMLKCKIKRNGLVMVKASGTCEDLQIETGVLVNNLYQNINKASPELAGAFKNTLIAMMLDPDSPVWKVDDHE